ncbi:MAG TPA: biotin carboxylase N-terminal domain-containing protein [Isosphaeraceae bacterium]|nr:biotin carboxylase N-terminal domain-containing protein [Isosphaeraceae bacterium]
MKKLGIRNEDRFALHRLKADEAYQVGKADEPMRSYLDIPAIVGLAQEKQVDAIHPGSGFLSENAEFAQVCARAGIVFVGPPPELLDLLGDKVAARSLAREIRDQEPLLVTDTTFRDVHQSLLATRLRTRDMLRVAGSYAHRVPNLFSIEMWRRPETGQVSASRGRPAD